MSSARTMFTERLRRVVETVPGAVGAIFADYDGEAVDQVGRDRDEIMLLGAHYGVILNHVQSALLTFHFGDALEVLLLHERMDLLVRAVGHGYFVVLAVESGGHLGTALRETRLLAESLRSELF
jgi:predicted regulator of Ras-like GTPase activity (Roadblock/LC7/MglB family)